MIERYSVTEITKIWNEESRFKKMLDVEMALLETWELKKVIPSGTAAAFKNVKINPTRISEIELETRHDVIAFCTSITEQVKPELARYFHFGVTSSDILDTALSLQLKESIEIIMKDLKGLIEALDLQIQNTKDLLCLGRSHGMAAEPMIFAQKFLSFQAEFKRRLRDYEHILNSELTGQISGAVGNYTVMTPEVESLTLKKLGLPIEAVSTQVIPRDHLALMVSIGALTATAMERLAVELRLLHHSDISEIHEGFKKGQKGSSTMPHKKNPISSENITGLARVIRSHLDIALENIVLWHERDISHSSTERLYLPDHLGLLSYSLRRCNSTILDLEIHREHIEGKVKEKFTCLSSLILHELIAQNATSRDVLYAIVQEASFQAKSYEEMISILKSKLAEKNLQGDFQKLDWNSIKTLYIGRFNDVLARNK
jgi:adenylosuccinate lyase